MRRIDALYGANARQGVGTLPAIESPALPCFAKSKRHARVNDRGEFLESRKR